MLLFLSCITLGSDYWYMRGQFAAIAATKHLLQVNPQLNPSTLTCVALVLNLVFSVFSFHFIDEPARRFIVKKWTY
jgi:hypothetical protein